MEREKRRKNIPNYLMILKSLDLSPTSFYNTVENTKVNENDDC